MISEQQTTTKESEVVSFDELEAQSGIPDLILLRHVQSLHDLIKERLDGVSHNSKSKYVKAMRSIETHLFILLSYTKEYNYVIIMIILNRISAPLKREDIAKCFKNTKKDQEEKAKAIKSFTGINQCLLRHLKKK